MRLAMKCKDMLALLNEYVDGTLDSSLCAEFDKHMAGCNPCQIVVDNIRKTITLYKNGEPYELPSTFRRRLHAALRKQWNKKSARKTRQRRRPSGSPADFTSRAKSRTTCSGGR